MKTSSQSKSRKLKDTSDSEEEWDLESSDDSAEEESLADSDSESDYCSSNTKSKRLSKGLKAVNKKRKALCDSDDDVSNVKAAPVSGTKRPPKPVTASFLVNSSQTSTSANYSQYNALSQGSPASSKPTSHSTPNMGESGRPPHITPSPRNGRDSNANKSPPVVNRIPLPEGVTGLGSHDHNSWHWLKPENRKDKDGRRMDHPEYNPRTIYIPDKVIKEQTPAMRQWFEIKQDYFDTVLFFKVSCNHRHVTHFSIFYGVDVCLRSLASYISCCHDRWENSMSFFTWMPILACPRLI